MVSFQPNMQAQDDLAALFSRNLNFNPELQSQYQDHNQAQAQAQAQLTPPKLLSENESERTPTRAPSESIPANTRSDPSPAPVTYSISQHYTHSAHLARQPSQVQAHPEQEQHQQQQQLQEHHRRSSEPTASEQLTCEMVLTQQGIDPALLTPSQVQLFRISEDPHKERLIELWRVAPPVHNPDNPSLAWTSTTLEQEELLARLRYERLLEEERQQQRRDAEMTMDCGAAQVQSPDGRWFSTTATQGVEPYMMSGYEELMRGEGGRPYNHATDPVYKGPGDAWLQQRQVEERQMRMENQYGAFQQHQFGGPGAHTEAMEIM